MLLATVRVVDMEIAAEGNVYCQAVHPTSFPRQKLFLGKKEYVSGS